MKLKLNICVFLTAAFFAFGVASNCFAQDDDEAGGYVKVAVTDANVKNAANFAVKERAAKKGATISLLSISNAQQQIVAGVNYELCMEVGYKEKNSDETIEQFVRVVVYRNLKNVYSLTSWAEDDCAGQ